jgi:hypothetical protein
MVTSFEDFLTEEALNISDRASEESKYFKALHQFCDLGNRALKKIANKYGPTVRVRINGVNSTSRDLVVDHVAEFKIHKPTSGMDRANIEISTYPGEGRPALINLQRAAGKYWDTEPITVGLWDWKDGQNILMKMLDEHPEIFDIKKDGKTSLKESVAWHGNSNDRKGVIFNNCDAVVLMDPIKALFVEDFEEWPDGACGTLKILTEACWWNPMDLQGDPKWDLWFVMGNDPKDAQHLGVKLPSRGVKYGLNIIPAFGSVASKCKFRFINAQYRPVNKALSGLGSGAFSL